MDFGPFLLRKKLSLKTNLKIEAVQDFKFNFFEFTMMLLMVLILTNISVLSLSLRHHTRRRENLKSHNFYHHQCLYSPCKDFGRLTPEVS
jgi:hypothetical protein